MLQQTISALTTMAGSLAGSLAGGNSAGALTGAQAAKNEVENNYLAADQITRLASKVKDCRLHRDESCIKQAVQAAVKLSDANSNAMRSESCRNDRACLDRHMKKIEQAAGVYQQIVGLAQGGVDTAGLAFGNSATPTLTDTRYYYDQIRLNPELQTPFEKQFYAMSANNRAGFETLIFGKPLNEKERFALLTGAVGNPVQGVLADAAVNYAKEAGISPQQLALLSVAVGTIKGVRAESLSFSADKNGVVTFPDGISFKINQPAHLSSVEKFSQAKGVTGGHNAEDFYSAAKQFGIKVLESSPTQTPGISHVKYMIPAKDREGNVVGFKGNGAKPFEKTVYDPVVFSNEKMLQLGQQAAAKGYKEAMRNGHGQYDSVAGGVVFRVYLDKSTGEVRNFHPK